MEEGDLFGDKDAGNEFWYPKSFWGLLAKRMESYMDHDNHGHEMLAFRSVYRAIHMCHNDPENHIPLPDGFFSEFKKYWMSRKPLLDDDPPSYWQLATIEKVQDANEDDPMDKLVYIHGFKDMRESSDAYGRILDALEPTPWANLKSMTLEKLEDMTITFIIISQPYFEKHLKSSVDVAREKLLDAVNNPDLDDDYEDEYEEE